MFKFFAYPKLPTLLRFYAVLIVLSVISALTLKYRQAIEVEPQESEPVVVEAFVSELPDFQAITDIDQRKQSFFAFLHKYIDSENQRILKSRQVLVELSDILSVDGDISISKLSSREQRALDVIATEFRLQDSDLSDAELVEELLVRVDVIPVSLALAQAANESAWGTSRFAREGNNIFGQWCFDEGCGLIPGRRADAKSHEVRAFPSIEASVTAYFRNLNTNPTYEYLRELRAQMRMQEKALDPLMLAAGLTRYSERGHVYVAELQDIIRYNDLRSRDQQS